MSRPPAPRIPDSDDSSSGEPSEHLSRAERRRTARAAGARSPRGSTHAQPARRHASGATVLGAGVAYVRVCHAASADYIHTTNTRIDRLLTECPDVIALPLRSEIFDAAPIVWSDPFDELRASAFVGLPADDEIVMATMIYYQLRDDIIDDPADPGRAMYDSVLAILTDHAHDVGAVFEPARGVLSELATETLRILGHIACMLDAPTLLAGLREQIAAGRVVEMVDARDGAV